MERFRVWGTACLVFWSLNLDADSSLRAAQPSDAVPETAEIVVRWKSPKASLGRLGEFMGSVQPALGEKMDWDSLPFFVFGMLSGDGMQAVDGVDLSQDFWGLVFLEPGTLQRTVVYIVSATDVDAVKEDLREDYETHVVDKLVIFSDDLDALDKVRNQLDRNDSTLWSRIDADSKKLFDASDLSVLVNVRRLTDGNAEELSAVEGWIDALCDQISIDSLEDEGEILQEGERAQYQAILGAYGAAYQKLCQAAFKGVRDSNSLVLGVSFSETAIRIENTLRVDEETPTSSFLARQTASTLPLVTRLPTNQGVYYGISADMAEYMDWSLELTRNMFKTLSVEEFARLDAVLNDIAKTQFGEMAGYLNIDTAIPALRAGSVSMMTPTKPQREYGQMMAQYMSKMKFPGSTLTMKLAPSYDKIAGVEIDRMTMKQEFEEAADPTKFNKILYGGDGVETLSMYPANRELAVSGGGTEALQALIATLDALPAKGTPIVIARQRLTEKANLVVLADVARLILNGAPLAASEDLLPINASVVDGLKTESCFIGFSLTCGPTGIRSEMDIPLSQAQNIAKVVLPLISSMKQTPEAKE